jgi:dipeptidyl-peptidase 4
MVLLTGEGGSSVEASQPASADIARSGFFTHGSPSSFFVSDVGDRVLFLRSSGPRDSTQGLWAFDVDTATETLLAHPSATPYVDPSVAPEEAFMRRRTHEIRTGILRFSATPDARRVAFELSGRLIVTEEGSSPRVLDVERDPIFGPRIDPTGRCVAFVRNGALVAMSLQDGSCRTPPRQGSGVRSGVAEFVAAEEMRRRDGFWWSPDGSALALTVVDESGVDLSPAEPEGVRRRRYPMAGRPNADVRLFVWHLSGPLVEVDWDREALPYLCQANWGPAGLTVHVQARSQRVAELLAVDPATGRTRSCHRAEDPQWVPLIAGLPSLWRDQVVHAIDMRNGRAVGIDGIPITPPELHVMSVAPAGGSELLLLAAETPTRRDVYLWNSESATLRRVSSGSGVSDGVKSGGTLVLDEHTLDGHRVTVSGGRRVHTLTSAAEPCPPARVTFARSLGERSLVAAVLTPRAWDGTTRLPVILSPYGGPSGQRVLESGLALAEAQWLADRGFAVVVIDGRGAGGRSPRWERTVGGDLATPVVEDQVAGLRSLAESHDFLDLGRVGIKGWSFGGYLSLLAALRFPDVFHAAVAGAPVVDWAWFDTHYTERYLGMPGDDADSYRRSSIVRDSRPLVPPVLLIHGLADDCVLPLHSHRLSVRWLERGVQHEVAFVEGMTHTRRDPRHAPGLLDLEVAFLKRHIGG